MQKITRLLKRHLIPILIVVLVSLGFLYLPQLLITYNVPYLSSLIEEKDLNEGLALHYSFDGENQIPNEAETRQLLLNRLDEKLNTDQQLLHLTFDRHSMADLINRYSVTIEGEPETTSGRIDEALSFTGEESIRIEDFEYSPGSFTQAAWIYSEDPTWGRSEINYQGRWITKNGGELGGLFLTNRPGDEARAGYHLQYEDGTKLNFSPATVKTGEWYHLMASYNKQSHELRIYLNGKLAGAKRLDETKKLKSWKGLSIGGADNYWFNGKIDDVRVYDRPIRVGQPPGTTVMDQTVHSHTGIIHGNPEWIQGKFGKGLKFDGEDDYLTVPDSDQLDIANGITLSFWIRPGPEQTLNLLGKGGAYYFWWRDRKIRFALFNDGEKFGQTPAEIPLDRWTHVTGVYQKGEGVKVYTDGTLSGGKGPYQYQIDKTTQPFQVGYMNDWEDGFFNGEIDEPRIYNRPLPPEEIKALHRGEETVLTVSGTTRILTVLVLIAIVGIISYFSSRFSKKQ